MTLRGRPAGFLSSTYEVEDPDSGASGTLCMRWVREASEIDVDDPDGPSGTFTFERESFLHGAFLLVDDEGETLACAEKPSALLRSFEIEHDDETWRLEASSPFSRTFHLLDAHGRVGSVFPTGFLSRRFRATLPSEIPFVVRAFVAWLVLLMWRRSRSAAHAPP